MKVNIIVSTEVSTMLEVDIPINPKGSEGGQIERYIELHQDELAEKAYANLERNFLSDWKENVFIKTEC